MRTEEGRFVSDYSKFRIFVRLRKAILENRWVPCLRAGTFITINQLVRPGRDAWPYRSYKG
ncbi:hypothetical protein Desti_3334 [Desulfomonile tiedjei DSM 6799]|uniref:Uncharacterized protein n=1 Tax=Desulfomonile tiedjei (strain ATCC 49306 / DSM 6799 / DCB-1) TaxID=706587 RepID=I4C8V0_DESTA|nr:hypothetical protein Desti_3334 [Desulfomonile tiedjei DSM 6799]